MTLKQAAPLAAEDQLVLTPAQHETDAGTDQEPEDCDDPDETVDVEYEGRTYRVPGPLKGALMRQADYTRKTQELAQHRKSVDAARQHLAGDAKVQLLGLARLHALDLALAHPVDWRALAAQDSGRARLLQQHFQRLKAMRDRAAHAVLALQHKRLLDGQHSRARQIGEGRSRLHKEVEDWSSDLQRRILAAGKANEFSDSEIHSVTDPRMIKVLNKARQFDEIQARHAAAKRLTAAQAAKPVTEVGAKAAATSDPSRMTTAEWMRWRANNLRNRR